MSTGEVCVRYLGIICALNMFWKSHWEITLPLPPTNLIRPYNLSIAKYYIVQAMLDKRILGLHPSG